MASVLASILKLVIEFLLVHKNGGAKKTRIAYEANLNFKSADVYLKLLMDQKMIVKEDMSFKTTPKGSELLSNLKEVSASRDFR